MAEVTDYRDVVAKLDSLGLGDDVPEKHAVPLILISGLLNREMKDQPEGHQMYVKVLLDDSLYFEGIVRKETDDTV